MSTATTLNSFSENATRLTQRLQDLGRDFDFGTSTAALFDGPDDRLGDIRKMLDSNSDKEKIEALRRLIAVGSFIAQWLSETELLLYR
jgi:AP-3 complex subunit beta